MSGETETNVSAWTNDTVLEYVKALFIETGKRNDDRLTALEAELRTLDDVIDSRRDALQKLTDERDRRYEQRFAAQEAAVQNALNSAEKAVTKAEIATEKRFEGVNEFRGQLADQARTFLPRQEYTVQHDPLVDRVAKLETANVSADSQRAGSNTTVAYIISALIAATAIISAIVAIANS